MIFIRKRRSLVRLVPVLKGSNGNSALSPITTTALAGEFMLYWETLNTLAPPPLTAGFTDLITVVSDGAANDISARLQYKFAASDNESVPRVNSNRAIVAWYSNVDPTTPIVEVQPKFSNTLVSGITLPALAAFTEPHIVAAFLRVIGTTTIDAAGTGLTEQRTLSAGNAEAVFADSNGVALASYAGGTATTSITSQHLAIVCALLGAMG